jgi:pSer/pThr/pTyr-binding forkhead associated (FHA) protein
VSHDERIVGWLVCFSGSEVGRDFRIHDGSNSIGRAPANRICVNDVSVAQNQHASIVFNPNDASFSLRPGWSRSLVFVNDKLVLYPVMLNPYDKLTLGQSMFVFVPLCGDRFGWAR